MDLRIAKPLTLKCGLTLPNRLVKAAMAECMGEANGTPSPRLQRPYGEWSQGGWGMLITGNVQVDMKYLGSPGDVALDANVDSKQALQKWTSWASTCQRHGTPTVVQINHPGRQSPTGAGNRGLFEKNIAPSAIALNFGPGFIPRLINSLVFGTPKAMSIGDIHDVIDRFVRTARLAAEAGFSGVEIHAAHGYLLAQFLSAKSNQRTDDYGGSPAARAKIVIEIIKAVRAAVPKSFCVGVKLNSADHQSPEEFQSCLEQTALIAAAGIDFLEISGGTYENPTMSFGVNADATKPASTKASTKAREAFFLEFAEAIRQKVLDLPLIVTGGFRSRHGMETALEQNACDLIGLGRPAAMNPAIPKALLLNQEVANSDATIAVHRVPPSWWVKKIGVKALGAGTENTAVTFMAKSLLKADDEPGKVFSDLLEAYPGSDLVLVDAIQNHLVIADPSLLADLLVHNAYDFIKRPRIAEVLTEFIGLGLVTLEGDAHKFLRKNTLPAFNFRSIKGMYPMMWRKSNRFIASLKSQLAGKGLERDTKLIDMNIWASKVTLDIIGIAGLGRELNTIEDFNNPLAKAYDELTEVTLEKGLYMLLSMLFGLKTIRLLPWRMNGVFKRLRTSLVSICESMITDKREAIRQDADHHPDILSLLIKTDNFTDTELADQLLTFLAAGHETTSSSLSWASYLLAKHPHIQEAVRREVQQGSPDSLNEDLASTLERMPLLNGVINETLRLYPTVPLTIRQARCDTTLGNHRIPSGSSILVSPWMINRSPKFWGDDSTEFRPARWISEDGKPNQTGGASSNYHFITFLHGPRSCIGQGFARAELRCLLAALLLSFKWELAMPEADVVARGAVTIKPANGMHIQLELLESDYKW
ncbi:hypothetical protein GQX73_g2546 [Xylaria multiplex]|uniref:NADH:flavin oxidoreductase/NADH oxidase N-terminal domain-containing protein n=1 Tax=Xylaria multiplex TaxID=323545 RepID=A0A7C8MXR4_9PEZI|nr:hypothetical protein GQX73_g2546 [Xylaria multiplex]